MTTETIVPIEQRHDELLKAVRGALGIAIRWHERDDLSDDERAHLLEGLRGLGVVYRLMFAAIGNLAGDTEIASWILATQSFASTIEAAENNRPAFVVAQLQQLAGWHEWAARPYTLTDLVWNVREARVLLDHSYIIIERHRADLVEYGRKQLELAQDFGKVAHEIATEIAPRAVAQWDRGDLTEPVIARYQSFPVQVLPEPVRSFIAKSAVAIGCDASYVALPMLSALAGGIRNTRRIQLKRGWTEPAIIWTAIVGESGTLKTPAFKLVMQPIRDRQGEALKRYAEEQAEHEIEVQRYEKALAAWRRDKTDDDPPGKPQPPQAVRFIVSDTTVEALAPILLANPGGLLMARDELAGWIGSFDRYAGGTGGADESHWLSTHNGECLIVDRKTGQPRTIYVPSAAVSVTGGVQPGILHRALGGEHRESGLLARLLLAQPPRRPKRWTEAEVSATAEAAVRAIFDRLFELHPDQEGDGDPRPRTISLTTEGKRAWITFYNEHAREHADLTGDLSAAWSKLEGYAARLALIVHLTRWAADDPTLADADHVDETSIRAGVALSRWFGHEARRLYDILAEPDDERERRRLLELIQRKGGSATARDLMRSSRKFKTAADAEAVLEELVKMGMGSWRQASSGPRGGKPSKIFVLTDRIDSTIRSRGTLLTLPTLTIPRLATPKTRVLSTSTVSTLLTTHRMWANPTRPRPSPTMMSTMTSGGKSDAGDDRQC